MNANTSFFYRAIAVIALAQTATPLLGCDDSKPPVVPAARAGAGGAAGSAGRGGSGGRGGSAAPIPPPMPVPCGSVTCQLSTVRIPGLMSMAPCCIAAAEGTCGWMNMAGMCVPPQPVDPDCPPSDMGQPGCCVAMNNHCGVDATMFGAGCYELAGSAFANPVNNPARTCDGVLIEEDDAGVEDGDGGLVEPEPAAGGGGGAGGGGAGGTAGSSGTGGTGGSGGRGAGRVGFGGRGGRG